jgi:hypothetical protein
MVTSKIVLFVFIALGPTMLAAMDGRTVIPKVRTIAEKTRQVIMEKRKALEEGKAINQQLRQAVLNPNLDNIEKNRDDIERLLLLGADPNFRPHESYESLLEIALEQGNIDLATILLERGASFSLVRAWKQGMDISTKEYIRSLQWALEHGWNSLIDPALIYAALKVLSDQDLNKLGIELIIKKGKRNENIIGVQLKSLIRYEDYFFSSLLKQIVQGDDISSITLSQLEELPTPSSEEEIAIARAALLFAVGMPKYIGVVNALIGKLKTVATLPLTLQTALKVAAISNMPVIEIFKVIAEHYDINDPAWKEAMSEALVLAAAQGNARIDNNIVGYILDTFGDTIEATFIQEALERALLAEHQGTARIRIWEWIKEKGIILREGNWEENWGAALTRVLMFAALHGELPSNKFELFNEVFKYVQEHNVGRVDISAVALFLKVLLREELMGGQVREGVQVKLENALKMIESFEGEALQRSLTDNLKDTIEYLIGALIWSPIARGTMTALLGAMKTQSEIIK